MDKQEPRKLERVSVEEIVVGTTNLGARGYVSSDDIYKALRAPQASMTFGRCVFSQCAYSRG